MNTKLTFLILCVLFVTAAFVCKAQTNEELINRFRSSFAHAFINYKQSLFTIVKIKVDEKGHIGDISFSESADSSYIKVFKLLRHAVDDDALSLYIKRAKIRQTYILMPLYITNSDDKKVDTEMLTRLMQFENEDFTGPAILLKPEIFSVDVIHEIRPHIQ